MARHRSQKPTPTEVSSSIYGGNASLRTIKKRVKHVAIELCYPQIVQIKIDNAKTEEEIDRIMRSARKGEYDGS